MGVEAPGPPCAPGAPKPRPRGPTEGPGDAALSAEPLDCQTAKSVCAVEWMGGYA